MFVVKKKHIFVSAMVMKDLPGSFIKRESGVNPGQYPLL